MANWLPRTQVPGQQVSVTHTTTPLLPGASALLDLAGLGRLGHFLAVSTDAPGWVSFYSSAAAREADGSRPITQDPAPSSGVLLDLVTTASALTVTAPPGGTYFSADGASAPNSPPLLRALVRNTGTSQAAIAVTVTAVVLAP
ncbi:MULTISPECIES: hypothetical protein [unclassified Cyanobium]|jgi:hypothetical protein|uniref:hypothetical protein n=1 Tax=unclassified Cyanobium TaxID=2627006 RepID=UPI0020CDE4EA|nr:MULTISPECIES: hypothetical protein [unclassified Cyanobium]MCP9860285.1 hypothetical protein [Cyanobium sp. Cruz-8H5]MCP9867061.1 hypothetical protein [Cyanobium sp. Cruz-8D1]